MISAKMLNFFGEEEHLAYMYCTTSYDEYMYSCSTIFSGLAINMKHGIVDCFQKLLHVQN